MLVGFDFLIVIVLEKQRERQKKGSDLESLPPVENLMLNFNLSTFKLITYVISGNIWSQLLDFHSLVIVALPAQQHLTVNPLQSLRCLRWRNASRYTVVKMLHVLSWDGFVVISILIKIKQTEKREST